MKGKKPLVWFPVYVDKHLFGSTRLELEPDERSVWMDLVALSQKDEGFIRAGLGMPYRDKQLAGMLVVSEELLQRTIEKCLKEPADPNDEPKLKRLSNGTLYAVKWKEFRLSPRHKRRFNFPEEPMSPETDIESQEEDEVDEVEDTKEKESKDKVKEKERIEKEKEMSRIKEEKAILKEFKQVKNFPRDEKKIIAYVRKLKGEFPKVDALRVAKEFYPYSLKNPLTKKSNPFARIRRFFINQIKFDEERDKELRVGQTRKKGSEERLPDKEWDEIAKYLYANGQEEKDVARFLGMTNKHYSEIKQEWEKSDKKPEEFARMILDAEMKAKTPADNVDYKKVPELDLEKTPGADEVPPQEEEPVDPPDRGTGRRKTAGESGYQQRHLDLFFGKWWEEHSKGRNKSESRTSYMRLVRSGKHKPQELYERPELVGGLVEETK